MAERFVAADSSPLIGLAAAGAFELLRDLFGRVTVTTAVRDEVLAGGLLPGAAQLRSGVRDGWIAVVRSPSGIDAFPELGRGEASTLLLALHRRGEWLVLMDDPLGRARARAEGIPVAGTVGVLLAAKRARLVTSVRPFFDRLAGHGFRASRELVDAALAEAGET